MTDGKYDHSINAPRVVSGEFSEYIVSHPGLSQYSAPSGAGVSSCGLAALNCARVVLGIHRSGLGNKQFVQELMKCRLLEARLA